MNELGTQFREGIGTALSTVALFLPRLLLFIGILIIGYFAAKLLCRLVNSLLERVGFDRLVERGGFKRMLQRSNWDASDILGTIVKYFVLLFTFQLAFGVFGPNPISALLTSIVAYLPNLFVAAIILIVAGAIAAGVRQLVQAALGGLSYGKYLATGASVAIWTIGIFAALNQLQIAPAIVNGLFYALLAVVVGSAIVAIGGGGIAPMRSQWERVLGRARAEAPRLQAEASGAGERMQARAESWQHQAEQAREEQHVEHREEPRHAPRFHQNYPPNP